MPWPLGPSIIIVIIITIIIIIVIIIVGISGLGPRVLELVNLQNLAVPNAKLQLSSHGSLLVAFDKAVAMCATCSLGLCWNKPDIFVCKPLAH